MQFAQFCQVINFIDNFVVHSLPKWSIIYGYYCYCNCHVYLHLCVHLSCKTTMARSDLYLQLDSRYFFGFLPFILNMKWKLLTM